MKISVLSCIVHLWTNRMYVSLCFTHAVDSRVNWTVWLRWCNVLY